MTHFSFNPSEAARGFNRPLSHAEVFTEPMELSSGLANANIATDEHGNVLYDKVTGKVRKIIDNLPEFTPGTFAKIGGKLKKASARSSIHNQRWNNPATAAKAHKFNPSIYKHLPTVKELEHRRQEANDARQRKAIRQVHDRLQKRKPAKVKPAPAPCERMGEHWVKVTWDQLNLSMRIDAHNGPQSTGPRDRPRLSCPELARRKVRRRKQPAVTPEERAAALALLNTPLDIPRAQFTAPKRRRVKAAAPSITTDPFYAKLAHDAATTTRSAWAA